VCNNCSHMNFTFRVRPIGSAHYVLGLLDQMKIVPFSTLEYETVTEILILSCMRAMLIKKQSNNVNHRKFKLA
jgi:hypothetical protein